MVGRKGMGLVYTTSFDYDGCDSACMGFGYMSRQRARKRGKKAKMRNPEFLLWDSKALQKKRLIAPP